MLLKAEANPSAANNVGDFYVIIIVSCYNHCSHRVATHLSIMHHLVDMKQ